MDLGIILAIVGILLTILGVRIQFRKRIFWRAIDKAFKKLELKIREYNPDVVVGLADGRIIGAIISANLRIPDFYCIDIPIKKNTKGSREVKIYGEVGYIKDKKVLLVDNHIYTGTNMEAAFRYLKSKEPADIKKLVFFKHVAIAAAQHVDFVAFKIGGKRKKMPWSYTKEYDIDYQISFSQDD